MRQEKHGGKAKRPPERVFPVAHTFTFTPVALSPRWSKRGSLYKRARARNISATAPCVRVCVCARNFCTAINKPLRDYVLYNGGGSENISSGPFIFARRRKVFNVPSSIPSILPVCSFPAKAADSCWAHRATLACVQHGGGETII